MTQNYKNTLYFIIISVLILLPIILLILPANFFDSGESLCLSKQLLDTECYGCGMTRSIMHLIHFEFKEAMQYNKLGAIVYPLLIVLWFQEIRKYYRKIKKVK